MKINISLVYYLVFVSFLSKILLFDFITNSEISFVMEQKLFRSELNLYNKLTDCNTLTEINKIRKKSKYRKKGYKGHPTNYFFSYPMDNKILISPIINGKEYLLIFIHCRPDEFYERMLNRKSISKKLDYVVIFITSRSSDKNVNYKIKYESLLYSDILQFNEIASYFTLSIQTVHMLLWSFKINYKYLLKTDIDVYINIPLIINMLKRFNLTNNFYAIGRKSKAYVIRDEKYSHYVPSYVIKDSLYPPYLQGLGYIIPLNTVKKLCSNIEYVHPKIWIEDVYLGYLYKFTNTTLFDISEYILRELPYNISYIINNINKFMLVHGFHPIEIYLLHNITNNYNIDSVSNKIPTLIK